MHNKWPVTGWNEYYDTRGKKYADKLKAKKRDPVPSVSGKPRQTDPKRFTLPNSLLSSS